MVIVYTKPNCVQCTATKNYMDSKGIEYNTIDITQDEDALALIIDKGFLSAPVVNANESWWSGFKPDMIDSVATNVA